MIPPKLISSMETIAVIDIGSNSIRLVIYQETGRVGLPIFNEKYLGALGRGLAKDGYIEKTAIENLFLLMSRFMTLCTALNVKKTLIFATAALREAKNGPEIRQNLEASIGRSITVLSGLEEAELSAYGILSSHPKARGIMGDLGGGSLEFSSIQNTKIHPLVSLPLGPFHLSHLTRDGQKQAVDTALHPLLWFDDWKGHDFYPVGGAWRALATIDMVHKNYPLRTVHDYTLSLRQAKKLAKKISYMAPDDLKRYPNISRRRLPFLPYTSLVMHRILKHLKPRRVVFSAYGLREGALYRNLPKENQGLDPLLVSCQNMWQQTSLLALAPETLAQWLAPIFDISRKKSLMNKRLIHVATLLSNSLRLEPKEYQSTEAFYRTLRLPFVGWSHPQRCFVALTLSARYGDVQLQGDRMTVVHRLLDKNSWQDALILGSALNLAYTLSGGVTALLKKAPLAFQNGQLILDFKDATLNSPTVQKRVDTLCRLMAMDVS